MVEKSNAAPALPFKDNLYWVSWYATRSEPDPALVNPHIIDHWVSGYTGDANIYYAWVLAPDQKKVLEAVSIDWPEIISTNQFRLINQRPKIVDNIRFKLSETGLERAKTLGLL